MKKILLLFIMLFFISPAFASNWVQIGPKSYIDVDSIDINIKGVYSAWFKDLNPGNWVLQNNKKVWYQLSLINFKCNEKLISSKSYAVYDLEGKILNSDFWDNYFWQPVIPDSIGELKYNAICRPNKDY